VAQVIVITVLLLLLHINTGACGVRDVAAASCVASQERCCREEEPWSHLESDLSTESRTDR